MNSATAARLDRLTALAASLLDTPVAYVVLVDETQQIFSSRQGAEISVTPREHSFCAHVLPRGLGGLMVVEDATKDERFIENPLVLAPAGIRFYVGTVLASERGDILGTLCAIDTNPKPCPTDRQVQQLRLLARAVVDELEYHAIAEANRERQLLLELAETMSGVGHWRLELETNRLHWSKELYVIHGVSQNDYIPELETAVKFYHPDDRKNLISVIDEVRRTGEDFAYHMRLIRRDGAIRHVACRAHCQLDEHGSPLAFFGVFQDVTESMDLIARAEAAAVAKTDFLANMSHELRTPLTSIIGFTKLTLLDSALSETSRRWIGKIDTASQQLLTVVNDVLDFTALEAGHISIKPQPVDIVALGQVMDLFTSRAAEKGLQTWVNVDRPKVRVLIDADRVSQILLNLLANAVKFTQRGEVTLNIQYDLALSRLRCTVLDTGPGISDADQEQLFQRFSQVDGGSAKAHGGTGLGLAICKGLVDAMSGVIGVASETGSGSQFWFELPAPAVELEVEAA